MSTRRRPPNGLRPAVLLVTTALVTAGCGDDDAAPATAPVTMVAAAVAPTSTTVPTTSTASTPITSPATSTSPSAGVGDAVDPTALQATLDAWRRDADTFGVTASIRRPGHADIHLVSGVDDRAITARRVDGSEVQHTEAPMRIDGTFPIGYITRTFVAAAALQLVDEGRITLDEPVTPWLPELPDADRTTLRMLLGYTAGLGQWDEADQTATLLGDLTRTFSPEEVLAEHLRAPAVSEPGGDPSFGRASYVAVGLLVERLLGTDIGTVVHDRFVAPLDLDETTFTDGTVRPTRHGWIGLNPAPGSDRGNDILDEPHQAVMTVLWASEAMISSSTDLLDWGEALFTGRVLGPTGTAALLDMNPTSPPPVPNRYFGLGATGYCLEAGCEPDRAELVGAPGGGFCCWSTQLVHDRRNGTTIVVATNTNTPTPAQLIDLTEALLADLATS